MASISGANMIWLKGDYGQHEEGILKVAAYPGMNLVMTNDQESQGRHSYQPGYSYYVGTGTDVTAAAGQIKVLKEDVFQGKTVDDAWAANDNCQFYIPLPGDIIQVLVLSGQTVRKGDGLSANSAGKWVVDATEPAVQALEKSNGALSADTLVRVRVL